MLKRRQPRGISGGGIVAGALPPPEIARGRSRAISTSPQGGDDVLKHDTLAAVRPVKLFERPEAIEAVAEVPDGPPVRFKWRRTMHQIIRVEGPERIALPWWRDNENRPLTRDYFRVETDIGARLWLYRDGLYGEALGPRWFLHGFLP